MKVALVHSFERRRLANKNPAWVGKPPTLQECDDGGLAVRRQQEWTGQVQRANADRQKKRRRV